MNSVNWNNSWERTQKPEKTITWRAPELPKNGPTFQGSYFLAPKKGIDYAEQIINQYQDN
jgi:hypothetical protein